MQVWDLGGQTSIRPYWYVFGSAPCFFLQPDSRPDFPPHTSPTRSSIQALLLCQHRFVRDRSLGSLVETRGKKTKSESQHHHNNIFPRPDAIIYVVDSADRERIGISKEELMSMLEEEELKKSILMVFANKQDQPGAMTAAEV